MKEHDEINDNVRSYEDILQAANIEIQQAENIISKIKENEKSHSQSLNLNDIDSNIKRLEKSQEQIAEALKTFKQLKFQSSKSLVSSKSSSQLDRPQLTGPPQLRRHSLDDLLSPAAATTGPQERGRASQPASAESSPAQLRARVSR